MSHAGWSRSRCVGRLVVFAAVLTVGSIVLSKEWVSGILWSEPIVVDPGPIGGPPSDAVVLFDGTDLSQWNGGDKWLVENGCATAQGGDIQTMAAFGDCQLHIEWATPDEVKGSGQGRGNSGVFFGGRYEVQVLDSFDNKTYFDGQAGSLYKTKPPLVNACRQPGEWQTYDIIYNGPRFNEHGQVVKPGYFTVLHNGVLIQNHTELLGDTTYEQPPSYHAHADAPIRLQFHGDPVRFRNIWLRPLAEPQPQRPE